jgi:hypothetical protein
MYKTRLVLTLFASIGIGYSQTVIATSGSVQTNLPLNSAKVAFVASSAKSADEAATQAVLSTAAGTAVATTALRMIPIVGPLAGTFMGPMISKFHKPKPVTGFSIAFIPGLTAGTVLQPGEMHFIVPAQALQGANSSLVRLKTSLKDSSRIVRSVHLSAKVSGNSLDASAGGLDVLGIEQDEIPCKLETRPGGDIVITPSAPLASGEYAVVTIPTDSSTVPARLVWDFHVAP